MPLSPKDATNRGAVGIAEELAKTAMAGIARPMPRQPFSMFSGVHHIAIIASNYAVSRRFYVDILALAVVSETYRAERDSWKLNLALPDGVEIELFSFPSPPARLTRPEAAGLRHLALRTQDFDGTLAGLEAHGVACEPVRVDELTAKRYTFFADPDGLPIEVYES